MKKRLLSVLLIICVVFSLMPGFALADEQVLLSEPGNSDELPYNELNENPQQSRLGGGETRPAVGIGQQLLGQFYNTEKAAKVWLGFFDSEALGKWGHSAKPEVSTTIKPACWRVVSYEGEGVVPRVGRITLLAENYGSPTTKEYGTPVAFGSTNKYYEGQLRPKVNDSYCFTKENICMGREKYYYQHDTYDFISDKILWADDFTPIPPFSDGVSGEPPVRGYFPYYGEIAWSLSSAEAYKLDASLRLWSGGAWWLRSPGFIPQLAAYVDASGTLQQVGQNVFLPTKMRPACHFKPEWVGGVTAADNSEHHSFGKIGTYNENVGYKVAIFSWQNTDYYKNIFQLTGNTVLPVNYTPQTYEISHYCPQYLGNYNNITAALSDESGRVLYYGSINTDVTAEKSSFTIPTGLAVGKYTLTISYETWNDSYLIDLISPDRFTEEIEVTDYGIRATVEPVNLTVVRGTSTEEKLTVSAEAMNSAELDYQWFICSKDKQWSKELPGATEKEYNIPSELIAGEYYYFCRISPKNTTQTMSDVDTDVAKVTITGNYGGFHVVNNGGANGLSGVEYNNGVLTFQSPGSYTVSQNGGVVNATADRIAVELPSNSDELTLVLDGVNIMPPQLLSNNALTIDSGSVTLKIKGENSLEGGSAGNGGEFSPGIGGAGLYINKNNGAVEIIGNGDENSSISLIGGMGGYDGTSGRRWGGGKGGCGICGYAFVDGSQYLSLYVVGGQGGNSYRSNGGKGGYGVGGELRDNGGLSISGDRATVTLSAGTAGTGNGRELFRDGVLDWYYFDQTAVKAAEIIVADGLTVAAGKDVDSELSELEIVGGKVSTNYSGYIKITNDDSTWDSCEIPSDLSFDLGIEDLWFSERVWIGNTHVTYDNSDYAGPVPWLTLNEDGFMLSEDVLGTCFFDSGSSSYPVDQFKDSDLFDKLESLYSGEDTMFSAWEQAAIVAKNDIVTGKYSIIDRGYIGHLYPLSRNELLLTDYKEANYITGEKTASYWLRDLVEYMTMVYSNGKMSYLPNNMAMYYRGIRPAMNLDPDHVLFSSPAVAGKSEPGMTGGLVSVKAMGYEDKKLTLLDEQRQFYASSEDFFVVPGDSIEIEYTGAAVGINEYVSALLVDSDGQVLYYGRLTHPNSPDGLFNLKLPLVDEGYYSLYVFSEQCNEDYQSDYGSAFCRIELNIVSTSGILMGANGFNGFDRGDFNDYIYFGQSDGSPVKWRILDEYYSSIMEEKSSFLLSEYLLTDDDVPFSEDGSTVWQDSDAQNWCGEFFDNSFSHLEKKAVKATSDGDLLENDKVFFVSKGEASSFVYGLNEDYSRKAYQPDEESQFAWWLRSAEDNTVDIIATDGEFSVSSTGAGAEFAARPAFNLDHDLVLFTQAADNRAHGDFGVTSNHPEGENWKLTLKDDKDFSVGAELSSDSIVYYGESDTLTIKHMPLESFTAAEYTNVTALLLDENENTIMYGSINEDVHATSSIISFPSGLAKGDYNLLIYAEQWNAPGYTDYGCGTPFAVSLTVVDKGREHGYYLDNQDTHVYHMPENESEKRFQDIVDLYESSLSIWPFSDVSQTDWFFEAAQYVWEKELMNGVAETEFGPELTVTRGMIAAIVYRLAGQPEVTADCPFDDVEKGKYYENAIIWAAKNSIVNGYGNGKFGPEDEITREQAAAVLFRYAKYMGKDVAATADLTAFIDYESVSAYAVAPMSWANAIGLIEGKPGSTLDPGGKAKRCEAAAIIQRFASYFNDEYAIILP